MSKNIFTHEQQLRMMDDEMFFDIVEVDLANHNVLTNTSRSFEDKLENVASNVMPLPRQLKVFAVIANSFLSKTKNQNLEVKTGFTLMSWQEEALYRLIFNTHQILALDMGLGKTATFLALVQFLNNNKQFRDVEPSLCYSTELKPTKKHKKVISKKRIEKEHQIDTDSQVLLNVLNGNKENKSENNDDTNIIKSNIAIQQKTKRKKLDTQPNKRNVKKKQKLEKVEEKLQFDGIRCLLIGPKTVIKSGWLPDLKKFTPELTFHEIKSFATADFSVNANIIFMSESLLSKDIDEKIKQTKMFDVIGVDEAQSIKNIKSSRSKSFYQLINHSKRIVLLTGTPSMTHENLFGLLHCIHPLFKYFFNRDHFLNKQKSKLDHFFFAERYCVPKQNPACKGKFVFDFKMNNRRDELRNIMKLFIIRIKKDSVAELPPLTVEKIFVGELNCTQKKEFANDFEVINQLREKNTNRANAVLTSLVEKTMNLKTPFVLTYLRQLIHQKEKFVCFFYHKKIGRDIENLVKESNVDYIFINSDIPQNQRVALLDRCREDDNLKIAILSYGCCGTGLTLTKFNRCLFVERVWDAQQDEQAKNRLHRIGQKHPVLLQYLDMKFSTDTLLEQTVKRKCYTQAYVLGDITPRETVI